MPLDLPLPLRDLGPWKKRAAQAWALVLIVVCTRAVLTPRSHSLYHTYAVAGAD